LQDSPAVFMLKLHIFSKLATEQRARAR